MTCVVLELAPLRGKIHLTHVYQTRSWFFCKLHVICQKLDKEFLITLDCISNIEKRVTKFDVFDTLINTKLNEELWVQKPNNVKSHIKTCNCA